MENGFGCYFNYLSSSYLKVLHGLLLMMLSEHFFVELWDGGGRRARRPGNRKVPRSIHDENFLDAKCVNDVAVAILFCY